MTIETEDVVAEMIAKLRRERVTRMYEGDYINPNGPAAADLIQSLSDRIDVLTEALELTVPIIEEERQVCFDSNVVGALRHPDLGKVIDPYALAELAKYDEALSKARNALTKEAGIHGEGS